MTLVLASSSPIRRQILDAAGVAFDVEKSRIDEAIAKRTLVDPERIASELSTAKALDVSGRRPRDWVIGSDSVISVAGRRFDKPRSRSDAAEHLRFFSGKEMRLTSGVALALGGIVEWTHVDTAMLQVRPLSDAFMDFYLDAEWPEVGYCAGAFRLEGRGVQLFEWIDGDHFTILGMPLLPLLNALRQRGLIAGVIRIALTGSIGMGKSTVARMFRRAGVPVFDADAVVRQLQAPDGPLVGEIGARFPGTVHDGILDREALAARVLDQPPQLQLLESIVHPAVQAARQEFVRQHKGARAILFEIPLLFETRAAKEFDKIIVVSAPADVQRARVLERSAMTAAKFEAILARQMPDEEKRRRADFIVETGGDLSTTEAQVRHILACLGLGPGE